MELMNSRMSIVDLNCNLVLLQYGEQEQLEYLHELIMIEFPEDRITMDELVSWASLMWEIEELERSFDYSYEL